MATSLSVCHTYLFPFSIFVVYIRQHKVYSSNSVPEEHGVFIRLQLVCLEEKQQAQNEMFSFLTEREGKANRRVISEQLTRKDKARTETVRILRADMKVSDCNTDKYTVLYIQKSAFCPRVIHVIQVTLCYCFQELHVHMSVFRVLESISIECCFLWRKVQREAMMNAEKPHKTGSSGHCTITAFHYLKIADGGGETYSTCSRSTQSFFH